MSELESSCISVVILTKLFTSNSLAGEGGIYITDHIQIKKPSSVCFFKGMGGGKKEIRFENPLMMIENKIYERGGG